MMNSNDRREQALTQAIRLADAKGLQAVNFASVAALCQCERRQLQRIFGPQESLIHSVELRALDNSGRYPRAYLETWTRRADRQKVRLLVKAAREIC